MTIKLTSYNKPPQKGVSMKQVREARKNNTCPFREPHNGVMPDATWHGFAAVALFGNEQPPAGFVQVHSPHFAARVFVPAKAVKQV